MVFVTHWDSPPFFASIFSGDRLLNFLAYIQPNLTVGEILTGRFFFKLYGIFKVRLGLVLVRESHLSLMRGVPAKL